MGIDHNAYLVYGFKVNNKKLASKIDTDGIKLPKDLEVEWGGSAYCDNDDEGGAMPTFITIKSPKFNAYLYDGAKFIKPEKLIPLPEWKEKLEKWAKENKCSKPKIGWWLLVSES